MTLLLFGVFGVIVLLICRISNTVKYYVKFITFMICSMICATVFVPFMLHRPRDSKNGLLPSWGCRVTSRFLLGVTYEVRGLENVVPEGQGCVVLINHQSSLDLVVMSYIWPHIPKGCQVAKREVLWLFPFGPATCLWGTVFIDKLNPDRAQKDINETGTLINSKHARLCMFPEGTRHSGDELLSFKKGAFHVALAAQCPLQPIVVSKYHHLDHENHRFDSGHSIIEILPAIPTRGLGKQDLQDLIDSTRSTMQEAFTRVSAEALKNSSSPSVKSVPRQIDN